MNELPLIRVPVFPRIDEFAGVWAMWPDAFRACAEKLQQIDLALHVMQKPPPVRSQMEMVRAGRDSTVAVIKIAGTMMKAQASLGNSTSTVMIRRELRQAAADPNVSAILLAIDSPGGTVAGTDDLATDVRAARRQKPVWAHVDDLCASAAYWVASQAEQIWANSETALVGSIGTLMIVRDESGKSQKEGVKTFVFRTGKLKGAGSPGDAITEEQIEYFQSIIDQSQASFDTGVRKGRRLTEKQLADVRSGGVFVAPEAQRLKLIEGIRSFDATLTELAKAARPRGQMTALTPYQGGVPPAQPRSAPMNFEQWAAARNIDVTTLDQANLDAMRQMFQREQTPVTQPTGTPTIAPVVTPVVVPGTLPGTATTGDVIQQMREEAKRQADIIRICKAEGDPQIEVGGQKIDLASHAITQGWDVMKTELEAMRAARASVQIINPVARRDAINSDVLEAALALSVGMPEATRHYKPDHLEIAHKHFRGMGLQQMLLLVAAQNGYHAGPGARIHTGNLREVFGFAFPKQPVASSSTVSLPGILGNVANKEILGGYMEEDQTWREIAAVKTVTNFHAVTSYRLLDSMEYEEVGPDGKIKHGSVSEESYTRQARTYAKMFALTRENIINDDMGAFQDLRARIGRGAAQKFNNVFWTEMLSDHSTFFTSSRGNYITGSTTTLLTDGVGLGLGVKAFRQMKSGTADGSKRIGGMPTLLVVPPELEHAADVLYKGEKLNVGSSGGGEENIYRNKYRPVVVPWLSDANFTGYSTTAWYLFRAPGVAPMMVVSFLNGVQTPTVESADADFDTLGVQFRGYHDFGADQAEYLCGVKSKGAA